MSTGLYVGHWSHAERSNQPKHQQDQQNKPEHAPEPGAAVSTVRVVAASASQQNQKENDDEDCDHVSDSFA